MEEEGEGRVPVFVSSSEVDFLLSDRSPRQVITLYNPYGYSIQYRVLCNAPNNYSVPNSNGILQPKSCKDLVIRCTTRLPVGCVDKLRIEIRRRGESKVHGSRDLLLRTIAERCPTPEQTKGSFFGMLESASSTSRSRQSSGRNRIEDTGRTTAQLAYVMVALACVIALMTPTQGDPNAMESILPSYFHLTIQQKLVASYILGIVTILLLRP
uniref:Motile sperm domain-containing protein 1 n=1 Tax=Heterorhabditis bacteriophora TaxID=37862 RepID=A0A1I7X5Q9_HETBA